MTSPQIIHDLQDKVEKLQHEVSKLKGGKFEEQKYNPKMHNQIFNDGDLLRLDVGGTHHYKVLR